MGTARAVIASFVYSLCMKVDDVHGDLARHDNEIYASFFHAMHMNISKFFFTPD